MKKKLKSAMLNWHLSAALLVLCVCVCLVSCDDDDNDEPGNFYGDVYADRAVFDDTDANSIVNVERYLYQQLGRLRNVIESQDGKLYIAVSNQDGRGDPKTEDDRILAFTQDELKRLQ